jgi:hypothetical protein
MKQEIQIQFFELKSLLFNPEDIHRSFVVPSSPVQLHARCGWYFGKHCNTAIREISPLQLSSSPVRMGGLFL